MHTSTCSIVPGLTRALSQYQIWEPTLRDLLEANASANSPLNIAEIWSWEAVNHGDAALVNAEKLGGICEY